MQVILVELLGYSVSQLSQANLTAGVQTVSAQFFYIYHSSGFKI